MTSDNDTLDIPAQSPEQAVQDLNQTVLEHLHDGVYYVGADMRIILWNKSAEAITGYAQNKVLGFKCSDNILRHINDRGDELCVKGCPLARTLKDGKIRNAQVFLHHKDGHRVPVSIKITPVFNKENQIIGAVEIFADESKNIDLIKELEVLRNKTFKDSLTQVGNRRFAELELSQRFDELDDYNIDFGILFFDIDHFKAVNDTHGHDVGDDVLKMVGKTVYNIIRSLDAICRWGGDEFVVILPNVDKKQLGIIAEKIRLFVEKTWIQAGGTILRITLSIGGTMARKHDTIEDIIHRADALMYKSKEKNRNTVTIG